MGFYEDFAFCYDQIFPADEGTVKFLGATFNMGGKLIDLACGTGGYSIALAQRGFTITGLDLSAEMIVQAKQKAKNLPGVHFKRQDMTNPELTEPVQGWFCIGNSLVHLDNEEAIQNALQNWRKLLLPGGKWVVQILNYDRILDQKVTSIPTLVGSDGTSLTREYRHVSAGKIIFKTQLNYGSKVYLNEVGLYPIRRAEMLRLLDSAGLKVEGEYGDFDESPWSPDSFSFVLRGSI